MNYPTSKRPNPTKYHPNNRCLLPFHKVAIPGPKGKKLAFVAERRPGELVTDSKGRTLVVQNNGSLIRLEKSVITQS